MLLKVGVFTCYEPNITELTLQNNEHMRGALLVGILRVAKAGWFSGMNNLEVANSLHRIC